MALNYILVGCSCQTDRQTDIFVIICSDFQEALSLLVYNTDHSFSMLAEALRSFHLSRKIEGDSVRRVIDQILGSYLLSCMAFSVYEVVRVTCLSPS